jgi:2'-5' RNA ligase
VASLNVPVPGRVERAAAAVEPWLTPFERVRDRHTLVAKRFETEDVHALEADLRPFLARVRPFEVRVAGVDYFETPTRGRGPVVYLAVESPDLRRLHAALADEFGAVEGLEGDDYVPHVTLARGGSVADAERLVASATPFDPVTWTASRLDVWSGRYRETVSRIDLR